MKRLSAFIVVLLTGALLLAACGGASSGTTGGAASGGSSSGGDVKAGSSGIKDTVLLGKWITADGGSGYNFKDDFTVVILSVGDDTNSIYNIVSGGNGTGKVEVKESSGKVTWDYKITGESMDLTTPEGRAKKLKKTT
ncbi:MAG TPA: hypothetical protein VGK87_01670 [Anaerolineae bacterium]|jgi:predicted small secreted protein